MMIMDVAEVVLWIAATYLVPLVALFVVFFVREWLS